MPLDSLYLERVDGHPLGILLEISVFIYCFCALAIVCDRYLVLSLETLCVRWNVREDVAGATLLALGSALPEIIISSVNTIAGESDLGVGAIIGSGMLAFSVLPGLMALAAGRDLALKRRPLARDSLTYLIALILLTVFFRDGFIELWEASALFSLYIFYVILVVASPSLRDRLMARERTRQYERELQQAMARSADSSAIDEIKGRHAALKKSKSFVEKMREAAAAKAELTAGSIAENDRAEALSMPLVDGAPHSDASNLLDGEVDEPTIYEVEDSIRHEPEATSVQSKLWNWLTLPLQLAFRYTCINCEHDSPRAKWYPLTFLIAFLWVAFFSFTISAVSSRFNELSGLPLSLFGIVLVAVGAEIPDAVQSLSVARRGYGSMAVSNSCGAQITNILVGLGLPWTIANIVGAGEGTRAGFECEVGENGEPEEGCVSAPVDAEGRVPWKGVQVREHEDALIAASFQFANLALFIVLLLMAAVAQGNNKAVLTRRKGLIMLGLYPVIVIGFCLTSQVFIKPTIEHQYYAPLE